MNPSNRGPGQSAKLTRDQLVNDVQSVFFVGSFLAVFLVAGFVLKIILLALLSFWSLKEYITMLSPPLRYHNLVAGTFLVVPLQYYWVGINWYGMFLVFIPLYVFLILPLYLLILPRRENRLSYISQLHWGLMAFVWGLSHLGFLYQLDLGGDGRQTQAIVGLVVVSVCGRLVNSTLQSVPQQFVPESLRSYENMTGFITSIVISGLIAWLLATWLFFGPIESFLAGLGIAALSHSGTYIMREVRDELGSGELRPVPGRGALISHVDSYCYSIPVMFHVLHYFYG